MTQIGEIVGKPGAMFVGPLPAVAELHGLCDRQADRCAGTRRSSTHCSEFLKTPAAQRAMKAKGMVVD